MVEKIIKNCEKIILFLLVIACVIWYNIVMFKKVKKMENQNSIHELPTLFFQDQKGKMREWTVKVDGDSYWTVAGCVGGQMVTSKPKFAVAKNVGKSNATTPEEQAKLQAKRAWDKRIEHGATMDMEIAKHGRVTEYFKPMLANGFNPKKPDFPYFSQPKLDGIRCIIRLEDTGGSEPEIVARTRNGKVIDCVDHIIDDLYVTFVEYPQSVIDGELYNHDLKEDFNKITSLVRKKRPTDPDKIKEFEETALVEAEENIQYWVYDVAGYYDSPKGFMERSQQLPFMLMGKSIEVVPTEMVETQEEADILYNQYLADGYEGQMLRKDLPYENRRSKSLLKRKDFQDKEYLVLEVMEGVGNREGTAGNLVVMCLETGKQFHSNIKANFTRLTEMLENKEDFIGKLVTIQYFNLTPDGIPRFPFAIAFRDYE